MAICVANKDTTTLYDVCCLSFDLKSDFETGGLATLTGPETDVSPSSELETGTAPVCALIVLDRPNELEADGTNRSTTTSATGAGLMVGRLDVGPHTLPASAAIIDVGTLGGHTSSCAEQESTSSTTSKSLRRWINRSKSASATRVLFVRRSPTYTEGIPSTDSN